MSLLIERSAGKFYAGRYFSGYFPNGQWFDTAPPYWVVGYFPVDPRYLNGTGNHKYQVAPGKKIPGAPARFERQKEAFDWLKENIDRVNDEIMAQTEIDKAVAR